MKILSKEVERSKLYMIIFTALFLTLLIALISIKIRMDGIDITTLSMAIGFIGIAITLLFEIIPDKVGALANRIRRLLKINIAPGR